MNLTRRSAGDNFHAGRQGHDVDMIVIHVTEGNRSSVRDWFGNDGSDVSAHYQVCTDGTIDQFVDESDTAFHAGRVLNPTAPLVLERPGVNPNLYSIGIEHEGDGKHALTSAQRSASLELIRDIQRRRPGVRTSRRHIVGHHEVYAAKTCPGAIDVPSLVAELALGGFIPARPLLVWSNTVGDWLVVTKVISDTDWEFVSLSAARRGSAMRATTPLSRMPLVAP